ncbi:MAG: alpha/beta hydrolase [Pseudolabrys sp.]
MTIQFATTPTLRVAYERGGPVGGPPVILLHGWPDDVRTFERMVPAVQGAGFQTVVPWLRGFGPTSFLSSETMRSGEMVAMAQDTLDLANALKLNTFVVGHDWGARIAYVLAAVQSRANNTDLRHVCRMATRRASNTGFRTSTKILVSMVHGDRPRQ